MPPAADVVEPVDTPDLKSVGSNAVRVRVPPSAPLVFDLRLKGRTGTVLVRTVVTTAEGLPKTNRLVLS